MTIDYHQASERYRPTTIKTLLVGEAPPPSRKTYFYVPRAMDDSIPIRKDRTLPATIFHHFFQTRPTTEDEYIDLLCRLKDNGIFLIDICDDPVQVRGSCEGELRIIEELPKFPCKMESKNIRVPDEDIIFLLARNSYEKYIEDLYPTSKRIRWIDFRMNPEPLDT